MQLFAIGAAMERQSHQSRHDVEVFLRQQVSLQRIQEYLLLYDEFTRKLTGEEDDTKARKRIAVSSVKTLRICTEINKELNTRQKFIVFTRLMEFMHTSGIALSPGEIEFLETVASVFTILPDEYQLISALTEPVFNPAQCDSEKILIVSGQESNTKYAKTILTPDVEREMFLLYLEQADLFLVRWNGEEQVSVNGQPVDPGKVIVLTQGGVIRSAKTQPLYYNELVKRFTNVSGSESFSFTVNELEYVFQNGRQGIHKMNFSTGSGNLVGIMGGSGAGKSTLLSVLNGSSTPTRGSVMINGINLHSESSIAEGLIGNVPQDDLLIEELTVFQNLYFNTRLCFGNLSDEEIRAKVNATLEDLGLTETRDLRVGNPLNKTISGGQRKRLNIGLELIREPSILFVDEPTSGLSSRDAENVMDLLRQLSREGKLIFVVIHQPSSDIFRMFDQLLMLDTGGFPVYFGNPTDAVTYFKRQVHLTDAEQSECPVCGNINPEQLFNILELHEVDEFGKATANRRIGPKDWYELYTAVHHPKEVKPREGFSPNRLIKASPFEQWKIFFTRDLLSRISNRQYMLINLLEAPLLGLILGFILRYTSGDTYKLNDNPNLPAFLFISVIVALFLGLSVSAEEIIRDRRIRQREKFLHLSKSAYLISKVCLLFIMSAIQTIGFVIIGNLMMGIHDMNLSYLMILFSTACFANLLGLNISAAFDSAVTIYIVIPFLLIPQILLSGVIVKFDKLHSTISRESGVPLIGNIMTSRWSYEALAVEQYVKNPHSAHFYEYDAAMSNANFIKGWWYGAMMEKIDRCNRLAGQKASPDSIGKHLTVVRNELLKERSLSAADHSYLNSLNPATFTVEQAQAVKNLIEKVHETYINRFNAINDRKEALIASMISKEGEEKFRASKDRYENESLSDMVRNSNSKERLIVKEDRIIRLFEPVYNYDPSGTTWDAPLFSAYKNLFGKKTGTMAVNLLVIWIMTLALYITLYFDLLRKLVTKKK